MLNNPPSFRLDKAALPASFPSRKEPRESTSIPTPHFPPPRTKAGIIPRRFPRSKRLNSAAQRFYGTDAPQ
jgi:hypothetical protein